MPKLCLARVLRVGLTALCVVSSAVLMPRLAMAQVSVGDGGIPSYSQAIAVPPGIAGMSPKLSLLYAGGGVNGPLGHGWSVQGLSMITRCTATLAQDGRKVGVAYVASDKLCLDGQRLIQTDESGNATPSGGNNAAGIPVTSQLNDAQGLGANLYREFRTEKDIYARIRAYGYANGDSTGVSGPAYFRVWTKAGQIYEYGQGPASNATTFALIAAPGKAPIAWAVARISDTLGNAIDFKYEQRDVPWGSGPTAGSPTTGHEWNISEVQYSGNKVIFNYDIDGLGNDVRTDKSEAYQQGRKNVSLRRLKSITTYVNSPATALGVNGGTPVRTTKLTYDYGAVSKRSRIVKIQECAGGPGSTRCLPFTALSYASGGNDAYQANSAFTSEALASLDLIGNGTAGALVGDFNGDGKTDIIYWSDTPANNKLYTSNGNGSFALASAFNITSDNLFKSDGCYFSIAADFNGDGATDILRVKRARSTNGLNTSCGAAANVLYLGSASGNFSAYTLPSSIDLTQTTSSSTDQRSCVNPPSSEYDPTCTEPGDYLGTVQSPGANFHLLDVDGDGYLDIVTTILPGFARTTTPPNEASLCASIVCTRVFRGQPAGVFQEASIGAFANRSVYAAPPAKYQFETKPYVVDFNGDGFQDLSVATGLWLSSGNGTFVRDPQAPSTVGCVYSIDFNGDGRSDCIYPDSQAATQFLAVGDGTTKLVSTANFNLVNAGQELGRPSIFSPQEPMGMLAVDINGDGRQDILRWKDDASQNAVYLSNGDGTFTASSSFSLAGTQLQKSNGTASVILGDFTGRGNAEFLRLQTVGGTVTNRLFIKTDSIPPDLLVSVTSPSGLTSKLYYVSLSNSSPAYSVPANLASDASLGARYQSDLGQSSYAVPDAVDLSMPMYVVVTQVDDTGVGSNVVTTELSYRGLKADRKGRGMLGFREVLRQRPGADGNPMTVDTQYLQTYPYTGVAASTSTYRTKLNATSASALLSTTSNFYCDQTNAAAASVNANCPVTAKVARPYLYQSSESGQDLAGAVLPSVSTQNVFNGTGDPSSVNVTTAGVFAGVAGLFFKTVSNTYYPNNTSCSDFQTCYWILGRLNQATVTNTVPNTLASIPSSSGTGANATAIAGSGPAVSSPLNFVLSNCTPTSPTLSPAVATYKCQLGNSGTSSASSMSYGTSSGLLAVNGPSSCAANTPNCGMVSMQTPSVAGSYTGYFTVSSAGATATSNSVTLTVSAPNGLGVNATSFSPASVAAGTSSSFSWSTTGATSASVTCSGAGVSVTGTNTGTAGNVTVGTTAATTTATCTVTATGAGGAIVSGSADLTVTSAGNVSVTSASFNPTNVPAGTSSNFSWNTANAASATVSCSGAGSTATGSGTSGTISVSTASVGTATCTVSAQDATGTAVTGSANLTVTAPTAPVIGSKAFSAANVTTGGTSTFSWSVSNATSSSAACTGAISGSATGTATGGSLTATAGTSAGTGTCTVTTTGDDR
ncbi:FG-GAP-like repeat-containing protein, partial [Roseateles sp. P5_D6]